MIEDSCGASSMLTCSYILLTHCTSVFTEASAIIYCRLRVCLGFTQISIHRLADLQILMSSKFRCNVYGLILVDHKIWTRDCVAQTGLIAWGSFLVWKLTFIHCLKYIHIRPDQYIVTIISPPKFGAICKKFVDSLPEMSHCLWLQHCQVLNSQPLNDRVNMMCHWGI